MPCRSVALVLILSACSGAAAATTQPPVVTIPDTTIPVQTTSSSAVGAVPSTTVELTDDPLVDNATAFVAALEEAFAGTPFEGAVVESPEVFIATAEVICVRLDNGDELDQILVDYIEGLSNTDGGADTVSENPVSEDTAAAVAGGVLGASLELFCPEYRQLIED